jgi:hypothetical protein
MRVKHAMVFNNIGCILQVRHVKRIMIPNFKNFDRYESTVTIL